jgi:uroporphyrinogen-III decarboxylase
MTAPLPADGRVIALQALSGQAPYRTPLALLTWGFDYTWKLAGLEPWQLACAGSETWHCAHLAIFERHGPDAIYYDGAGAGPEEPALLDDTGESWVVRDNNSGAVYELIKRSFTLREIGTGRKTCDPLGVIETRADADRIVGEPGGWGENYLRGLRRLIAELGDRALALPHHSPGYICACYAFGFEPAMEAMIENPGLFTYVCDLYAASDDRRMRELKEAGAQAVFIADSWASCDILSPSLFERFALPYQRSLVEAAQRHGLKAILWNVGDVRPILHHEAALPIDAFAVEQPRKGIPMSLKLVRDAFGTGRCLFGNLDSELLLWRNDPGEIRAAVREQIDQSGPGAPFIHNQGSPIPSNIEPGAVDAVIRAAREIAAR